LGLAGDSVEAISAALLAADADVLVTTGGASVGDHDHAQAALERLGGKLVFHSVAIRPGKPILFGTAAPRTPGGRERLVFGLPGNPAAATLGFELFVRPALRLLQGDAQHERTVAKAELRGPLARVPGLTFFPRGHAFFEGSKLCFKPGGQQSSMQIASWSQVNALGVIPPGEGKLEAGTEVDVRLIGAL
jgi:molybdopterin molybdotransferase